MGAPPESMRRFFKIQLHVSNVQFVGVDIYGICVELCLIECAMTTVEWKACISSDGMTRCLFYALRQYQTENCTPKSKALF